MRLAIFSDVHASLPALEAGLADIAATGVGRRYVLGDLVGYAPWPNEVLERLRAEGIPVVMGNYDDGTGFDRGESGCAYTDPIEKELASWALIETRRVDYDVEAAARAIEAAEPPSEFGNQLREARGYA